MESATQAPNPSPARRQPGIVVFGGGTATNSLVDVFERIRQQRGCHLSYVIPISDNGGSSSELIRVFGGPGMFSPLHFGTPSIFFIVAHHANPRTPSPLM